MMKVPERFACVLIILFTGLSVWAKDFGLVLDQTPGFSGTGGEADFDYSGILIPRFSSLLGDNGEIYISAGFKGNYGNDEWTFFPELLRTEITWRFSRGQIRAGRMYYADPLGFIADGLFDGARFSLDTSAGTFGFGAWYTGFLYKKRANIALTDTELQENSANPDYADFFDSYFTTPRIVSALDWEHPSVGELLRIRASLTAQFDMSDTKLHSQYAAGKVTLPLDNFRFDLGACLELIEDGGASPGIGLAGEFGIAWMPPTTLEDQLAFLGRFSSGALDGGPVEAFRPISSVLHGEAFEARLEGLSVLSLDYTARLHGTLSAGLQSSYFVRSDLETFPVYGTEGYFLGNEFAARVLWSPFSDLSVNLTGGIFLPSLGNAGPDEEALWRVEAGVILSIY